MKYKPPKCTCGTYLVHVSEETVNQERKILKNGRLSKNFKYLSWQNNDISFLQCPNCGCNWGINFDDKGRLLKGEYYSGL